MERLKKVLQCSMINKEVVATYFYENVKDSNGLIKTKTVEFYNCEGKKECDAIYSILNCTCFKEMKKIEREINSK
jgi:hypothetical protein